MKWISEINSFLISLIILLIFIYIEKEDGKKRRPVWFSRLPLEVQYVIMCDLDCINLEDDFGEEHQTRILELARDCMTSYSNDVLNLTPPQFRQLWIWWKNNTELLTKVVTSYFIDSK